ncbi:MAG: hypothetical protein VKJ44_07185 [Synechococcus sp.]|nr:hypothetical protein [Synechococcus sp.]
MTNLQQSAPILSPQALRRLWFGLPFGAGVLASVLVTAGLLVPQWRSLQADSQRLQELEQLQTQVLLMRQQLQARDLQEETALRQKDKLFRLIVGGGDVSTVIAALDRAARAAGIRLDLYEPQAAPAATPAAPAPPAAPPAAAAPVPSPLQQAGLRPYTMVISAHGRYPQLLDFQRRLERLSVLVIQNNVRLELPAPTSGGSSGSDQVSMKFSLTLYGQSPGSEPVLPSPGSPAPQPTGAPATATPATPAPPAPASASPTPRP